MTVDAADARALLRVAPDEYVAQRTRLAKEARAVGDRGVAAAYQALKRPNLSLWAVLAAGDDGDAVRAVVTSTAELAEVQAGGSDAAGVAKASAHRRKVLESLVDAAVKALARFEKGAEARRTEIRAIVDQLSRHVDLVDTWIDGTLRDLPDESWGFGAFAGLEVTAGTGAVAPRKATSKDMSDEAPRTASLTVTAEPEPRGPTRAERAANIREARREVTEAKRELGAAERRVDAARQAVREAEKEMRLAEKAHETADRRHQTAVTRLDSAESR